MSLSLFDPINSTPTNQDLITLYSIVDEVPPTQSEEFDNLTDNELIDSINELYSYLIETLIRFDGSPEYYKSSDYRILIKTIVNSLIYLYRYLPNLVKLLTAFTDLENEDTLTVVKNLTVIKNILGKLITSEEGFIKQGSSNNEVLLGGGGTKSLQSIYDISAGVVKEYADYTLDLLNQTISIKEDTEEIRQLVISETNQIKSDTESIKNATDVIKSDTQQIKEDTQDISNYVEQLAGNIGLGTPKGVYNTLQDLINTDPDHQYIYVVLDEGNWYYWGTITWNPGGFYQAPIDDYYDTIEQMLNDIETLQDSKVYLTANEYQILIDNNDVNHDIEYNIYEDDI